MPHTSSQTPPGCSESPVYTPQPYNRRDPNTWDVLYIDQAIPLDPVAKSYMLKDLQHWTRSYLLIPIKAIANIFLAIIMTIKRLLPFQFRAYRLMHQVAAFFLNHFVTPEACYLIIRHIGLGSNIANFLIENGPDPEIERSTLYPKTVHDLADRMAFLEHDLILYNFVWDYHQAQEEHPQWLAAVQERGLCFDSIQPIEVNIDFDKRRWCRILDLESAIELFKVFYSLCLTSDEFARAVLSLQLDENFGLYISNLTGDSRWNHVITNRHPLIPNSPFNAARDLFLHGLLTEYLHRYLELYQASR
ncbi:hypothetical protein C1752_08627 [Acaryochloris thomasi RCC1774]|uniref:Uncharacterized protein n=1 Tax=Acaryochloris thomasi RCC1774 TaxID=1764569 RepID=A0A2W1J9L7_9CYAN|nr:hypothetical protein [Acaryochloris thomasi]PZD70963.1 hypothetical protein C1752_08627 [Acaryochloris thomasi RCC1774]